MGTPRSGRLPSGCLNVIAFAGVCIAGAGLEAVGQISSGLPALQPTSASAVAPLSATATPADTNSPGYRPDVACDSGLLTIHANNSSLNGILRAVARCTGMRISGGVAEQRVFGTYGPAAPATVLATLIDGTGSNMLLHETTADQPAELILTPRAGGPTPPPPSSYQESEQESPSSGNGALAPNLQTPYGMPGMGNMRRPGLPPVMQNNTTPVAPPQTGSAVTSPPSIPQPFNNVNGSSANTSPTAATYPTTNSVPTDSIATPSTTPPSEGIVDAPNPPAAGSDTAGAMNGSGTAGAGATTGGQGVQSPQGTQNGGQVPTDLTPEQIFQQLQERQQQTQPTQPTQDQTNQSSQPPA